MFAILILTSIVAFAVAEETVVTTPVSESEITIPTTETVSATPDKPILWGLNNAIERISITLTAGKSAKAERGLKNAERRLLEIRQMIEEKKFAQAEKSMKAFKEDVKQVEARIKEIKDEKNPKLELRQKLNLQNKLEELEENQDRLETTIQVKVFGNLSEQEQEKVNQIIELLQNSTAKANIWLTDAISGAKIRIKAKYGLSDENLSKEVSETEEELNLTEIRAHRLNVSIARLEKKIAAANERISELEEKGKNVTLREKKLEVAEDLLEKLKEVQSTGDYSNLKEVIKETKVEVREVYQEGKSVRAAHAAEVISQVIKKLEERQTETGKNVSSAIEKLTEVQQKLQTRAESLKAK